jgi:electron transfer flavoprotein beta subunit
MRGLVAVKRVIDYAVKVRIQPDKKGVELNNMKMSMNPFCEIAVEEGIRLKEKKQLAELVAVSIGPDKCAESLRYALAMGADRAIHVKTAERPDQGLLPLSVAKILKAIVEKENPMMVLMGKQSIDGDNNQTGQLLAGMLNWPQATFASTLELDGASMTVQREVDAGISVHRMPLPAVITTDLRLNEPRYATLPNMMKAKKKPLETLDLSAMGIDITPRYEVLEVNEPAQKVGSAKVCASVDELISELKTAKVI